jgi:hypothetical protein
VKLGSFAKVGVFALSAWLMAGCAGNMVSENFDTSNRPQMLIPGANRADVRGLAMGAASAKGWTIVRSSDDLLVVQRPLDPASPTALALGAANSAVPPMIEVTSAFQEQSGGVNVALGAVLISQAPGEKAPKRVDYTENYRDALTQSLESLRSNWTDNRQRVANAIPPQNAAPTAPAAPAPGSPNDNPLVKAWGETLAAETAGKKGTVGSTAAAPAPEPRAVPEPLATPAHVPEIPPTPEPTTTKITSAAAPAVPAQPQRTVAGPAPVVDGSSVVGGGSSAAARGPLDHATPPQPAPELVATKDNMLTLSQASGTGTWAYYAEQYARLRGCNVTPSGSQLIETRADGEIHKVSCIGAESYLLKCQNGVCRGLE